MKIFLIKFVSFLTRSNNATETFKAQKGSKDIINPCDLSGP